MIRLSKYKQRLESTTECHSGPSAYRTAQRPLTDSRLFKFAQFVRNVPIRICLSDHSLVFGMHAKPRSSSIRFVIFSMFTRVAHPNDSPYSSSLGFDVGWSCLVVDGSCDFPLPDGDLDDGTRSGSGVSDVLLLLPKHMFRQQGQENCLFVLSCTDTRIRR
jgi:hypothetical protein